MRDLALILFLFPVAVSVSGQDTLTVAECYEMAEAHYPLIAQRGLLEKVRAFTVENASKGYLPQIMIGGQATYQSDVTQIPVEMPGVEPLSKDQYRIFGEITQNLYHGGAVRQQKNAEEVNAEVEFGKLAVDMYHVRDRINELFFGILLLREQGAQSRIMKDDLFSALRTVEAGIQHGTALRAAADVLRAELLRIDQRLIELQTSESSFREMLEVFTGQSVESSRVLEKPEWTGVREAIDRPELKLFAFQKQGIETSRALLSARKKPRVELFLQGGYGRPALNMLENRFDLYYIGGIRFNWLLSGYYTYRRENEILHLRQQSVNVQRETFLFNTDLTRRRHQADIVKFQRLIEVDDEIIALRKRVLRAATAQLEEGVISATDYVREANAADQAKQSRTLHEMQLLMAQAKYRFATGE